MFIFLEKAAVIALSAAMLSCAASPDSLNVLVPKYKADVLASITTPDIVETKYVGDLKFVDGFPTDETVTKTYDFLDTSRAVELFLNATPTTPYVHTEVDVKNGPAVFEIGSHVLGLLNDAYFRYVSDVGVSGPDKGKGGKYLVVGPDYKGNIPKGYFVIKTKTYRHWLLM